MYLRSRSSELIGKKEYTIVNATELRLGFQPVEGMPSYQLELDKFDVFWLFISHMLRGQAFLYL